MAIGHAGHGIAELAQELADVQRLCVTLANAEGPAERAQDGISDTASAEYEACSMAVRDIEDVGRRAFTMVKGLERLILSLEPRTPSEALSLALVLAEELDVFLCDHTRDEDGAVRIERQRLEDALQAVIRGLAHSEAESPLLDAYSTANTMRPWAQARSDATREACPYLVEYDPVKGALKQMKAARS
jgi:hypothetical protein